MSAAPPALPDLAAIRAAARRIAPWARRTPVLTSTTADRRAGARLFFKAEPFQRTGAFKFRGAANAVLSLSPAEAAAGVVTHSSGNHGAALALAARLAGIPCRVVMPEGAPRVKREAVAGYGAEIVFCAPTAEAREAACARLVGESGGRLVHPYDDAAVIAGQGTVLLELIEEVGDLDAVLVPVGGGGLASGVALAAAGAAPRLAVVGAEPAGAADAARSLAAGRREAHPPGPVETIADGLKAPLAERTFRALSAHLRHLVIVEEAAIVEAMRWVWERMKVVVEPSAAVPVAALFAGDVVARLAAASGRGGAGGADGAGGGGPRIGVVLSGGNVDLDRLPWA